MKVSVYHCGFVLCDREDEHSHPDSALLSKHCDRIDELVDQIAHAEAQVDELGNALGRVMVRLGVVNDESLTGPQLLFAAESWLAPKETPNAD